MSFCPSQPNVRKDRIGVIGWCMGGGYSLDVALQEPTLAATVINYGHLATDPDALKKSTPPSSDYSARRITASRPTTCTSSKPP